MSDVLLWAIVIVCASMVRRELTIPEQAERLARRRSGEL